MGYKDKSLWIGSCFTENMGGRLSGLKFNVTLNPSGIIYNPLSILTILKRIRDKKYYVEDELFFSDGLWHSDDHHGSFSHPDPNVCLRNINGKLDDSYEQLQEARFLFITFGNAWYFSSLSSGKGVANCHKRPASCFQKKILSFEEVKNCLEEIQALVSDIPTNIRIVYTASPVRHTAYGGKRS